MASSRIKGYGMAWVGGIAILGQPILFVQSLVQYAHGTGPLMRLDQAAWTVLISTWVIAGIVIAVAVYLKWRKMAARRRLGQPRSIGIREQR